MREKFRFKQFSISDQGCAMKLGTDAVLLGSWIQPQESLNILDIGSGCGILALMMAQKSRAMIIAVEIHPESAAMAMVNCMNSPWSSRLTVVESSFQDFVEENKDTFDLIISNPPYFADSLKPPSGERLISRHNDSLGHEELLSGVSQILGDSGVLGLILPSGLEEAFIQKAFIKGLYVNSVMRVRSKPGLPYIRSCMLFSRQKSVVIQEDIVIREADGTLTKAYRDLTEDFYL